MAEVGVVIKGRVYLRLEVRRIRSWASCYRPRDVVWLDFAATHKHLVANVTVTSARTKSNVPVVGSPLPQPLQPYVGSPAS
jgi:hypothetical protein